MAAASPGRRAQHRRRRLQPRDHHPRSEGLNTNIELATRDFVTSILQNGGGVTQRMACEAADLIAPRSRCSIRSTTRDVQPGRPIGVSRRHRRRRSAMTQHRAAGTAQRPQPAFAGRAGRARQPRRWKPDPGLQRRPVSRAASRWLAIMPVLAVREYRLQRRAHQAGVDREWRASLYNGATTERLGSNPDKARRSTSPYIWDHFFPSL